VAIQKKHSSKTGELGLFFQDHPAAAADGGHKQLQNTIPGGW